MSYPKVADLTVDELRSLVKETARQTILEILGDPDQGLELRDELKDRLRRSLAATETIPAHKVAAELGLEW